MRSLKDPDEFAALARAARKSGKSIGFVPTMGALHAGHGSLFKKSVSENDITLGSIFVNPTQFGPNEDLSRYPRTLESDLELLDGIGVDAVFIPEVASVYPEGEGEIMMHVRSIDKVLEGATRPGHFNGVIRVVTKLLNLAQADNAYFGQKDFQQLTILKILAKELLFQTKIRECPTERESDGLAMSSRNRYLSSAEREQATFLFRALSMAKEMRENGNVDAIRKEIEKMAEGFSTIRLDYFQVVRAFDFTFVKDIKKEDQPVALIAALCGNTRLIDNLYLFT